MKCPKCQTDNPDSKKFCRECGAKLLVVCPQCSSEVVPQDKFCGECGYDLRRPREALAIDYNEPQSYTPKHLAEKILTSRSSIEGERKLVTVMFADVAGFTAMAEKLDPEQVHEIMDGCFRILMDEIHRYEGSINQFRGDGVMALFGAPIAHEDHAQRACYAALAIQKSLASYAEGLSREYHIDFTMRIGLNSGSVVVGAIGDDLRMDYTAQGDTANLAARMESNAEPGSVLVSGHTFRLVKDFFEFGAGKAIQVKGKEERQDTYPLIRARDIRTRIEASMARGLSALVGRRPEMEALMTAFEKAKQGEAQIVDVVGEAGVGKSRLVYEFQKGIRNKATFLSGVCAHYGKRVNFLPVMDIVKAAFGIKEGMTQEEVGELIEQRATNGLASLIPFYRTLLSLPVDDPMFRMLDAAARKDGTFEAVKNLLLAIGAERPLVVFLEDVHWIDKISEDLFRFFARCIIGQPILMLSAYRPEGSPPWAQGAHYQRLRLETLSSRSSVQLVRNIVGGLPLDADLERRIVARTGGNPFFVEETVRELVERGDIIKTDDRYASRQPIDQLQIPDTIQGVLSARMDRLSEDLKQTMQVASVIGRDFAFRILKSVTTLGEDLRVHLANLVGLEILYEKALYPELEYIFKHALTQEVAYESLLKQRRRAIHGRIAQAIEELFPDRLEEHYEILAHHCNRSGDAEKTVHYLLLAGEKSNRQDALRNANDFFEKAFEIWKEEALSLDIETQVRLYHGWALANVGLGAIGKVLEGFKNSVDIARQHGLTDFERDGWGELPLVVFMLNTRNEAEQILNQGIARAREINDKGVESICEGAKAHLTAVCGRPDLGFDMLPDAERKANESGNRRAIGLCRVYRALIERWLGNPSHAIELMEPVVAMARNVASRQRLIMALEFHSRPLAETGRIEDAVACLKEGIDLSEKFGIPQRLAALHNTLGYCYGEICLPDVALQANEESRELAGRQMSEFPVGERGYAEIRAQASVNLMENLFDQGRTDEARSMLEAFHEESKDNVYDMFRHQWTSRMNYLEAQILLKQGDLGTAATIIEENLEKVREVYAKKREGGFLRLLGEVQAQRGESDSALSSLHQSVDILREVGNPRQLWQAHASLASALEHLGRSAEARQQWGAGAEIIHNTAEGLSDSSLREGFLNAQPIRHILGGGQVSS